MNKKNGLRPLLIMALLGSLSSYTWAENEKSNEPSANTVGVAQSASAIDPLMMDLESLLAQQPKGKLIDPTEQWLLAISRRPIGVGEEILAAEAEGLRKLPPRAVKAWQESRELLNY